MKAAEKFCRSVNEKLRPISAFLEAAGGGWRNGDGVSLDENLDDRTRAMVHDLQNLALWATMHIPHHIGLTKREEQK